MYKDEIVIMENMIKMNILKEVYIGKGDVDG